MGYPLIAQERNHIKGNETMKTLHFPATSGLSPRPFDAYDALCERYYWMCRSPRGMRRELESSKSSRRELEAELLSRFSSDDFDLDFTHGKNVATVYKVTVK